VLLPDGGSCIGAEIHGPLVPLLYSQLPDGLQEMALFVEQGGNEAHGAVLLWTIKIPVPVALSC
jgi:hypothetical protein